MIPVKTYDPVKQAEVLAGIIDGDVFRKDCTKNTHYMVVYRGYGIQAVVVDTLVRRGVKKVVIETKTEILTSDLTDWVQHGTMIITSVRMAIKFFLRSA